MATHNEWIAPIFTIIGVLVGALINPGVAWWLRKKRRLGHWRAIKAEVEHDRWQAQEYVDAGIQSPANRLITICYEKGFPPLLEDGVLSTEDTQAMLRFYDLVDQANRTLEEVNDEMRKGNVEQMTKDAKRVALKMKQVADRQEAYARAMTVIVKHLT
ncbi:MAG: hypothetical protein ABI900_05295 [Betaproteobacteria bacterium]